MGTRRQRKTVEMSRITKECNCDLTHILSLVLRRHVDVRVLASSTVSASRLAADPGDADDGAAVAWGSAPMLGARDRSLTIESIHQ